MDASNERDEEVDEDFIDPRDETEDDHVIFNSDDEEMEDLQIQTEAEDSENLALERILNSRETSDGTLEFLCKWKDLDYPKSTWKRAKSLEAYSEAIKKYSNRTNKTNHNPFIDRNPTPPLQKNPVWLQTELKDHQRSAIDWLIKSWSNDANSILSLEIGLGKIHVIAFLGYLAIAKHVPGPFLVISPFSVVNFWADSFRRYVPDLDVVVYSGNRDMIEKYGFFLDPENNSKTPNFDVMLTTYRDYDLDGELLRNIRWNYFVADEISSYEGYNEKFRNLATVNRLVLTGINKNKQELWNLLHFIEPVKFSSVVDFMAKDDGDLNHEIKKNHFFQATKYQCLSE
eukprot:TRINITY_DN9312_c0_g1_i1.p1 TRINITY_DN9312_c0_g1~~TRINITY_DN9312_c0_g1_i1.p1  ORF type:complete len:343 (+),score=75.65 TRINITY_DN9312_c0_g1_i1:141-1169(+)